MSEKEKPTVQTIHIEGRERNGYDRYLDFQYGQSGGFFTKLFRAISQADEDNLERLSRGFPEEVEAYLTWTRVGVETFLERVSPHHRLRDRFVQGYNLDDDRE